MELLNERKNLYYAARDADEKANQAMMRDGGRNFYAMKSAAVTAWEAVKAFDTEHPEVIEAMKAEKKQKAAAAITASFWN
jgi:hypothetical protein